MECSTKQEFLQPILGKGFDGMPEMMQTFFNLAMMIEREKYLHAGAYERTRAVLSVSFAAERIRACAEEIHAGRSSRRTSSICRRKKKLNPCSNKYKNKYSEFAQWLENELPEGFTVFTVSES